jgi:hypothetical protein
MTMIEWLASQKVCREAIEWFREVRAKAPAEAISLCPRGDWLLWLAKQLGHSPQKLALAVRPMSFRALREYARPAVAAALEPGYAELADEAGDDLSRAQSAAEIWVSQCDEIVRIYTWRQNKQIKHARAVARAACIALTCAHRVSKFYAHYPFAAAEVPPWVAEAARLVGDLPAAAAEHARCADEVRAAIPDLAARWSAAMEVTP